jgi:hypothetical protein
VRGAHRSQRRVATLAGLQQAGLAEAEGIEFIVHAMPARSTFVR